MNSVLLIVVGIQAAAIVALLVQRTRRMQVERDLRERVGLYTPAFEARAGRPSTTSESPIPRGPA